MDFYKERLNGLFKGDKLDSIVLINGSEASSNFLYMTGFGSGLFESAVLILKKEKMELLTNELEYGTALQQANKCMEVTKVKTRKQFMEEMRKLRGKTIGIDGSSISYNSYQRLNSIIKPKRTVDVGKSFDSLRSIKNDYEIKRIKKAVSITKSSFKEITDMFKAGMTEKGLAAVFDSLMLKNGADSFAFRTIVCFDKNSAMPHHMPGEDKLKANSVILIDAGAKYGNYCADMTRSFIFKPNIKTAKYKGIKDMYDTVKEAQLLALKAAKPSGFTDTPHKVAERFINNHNKGIYKGRFIHALGHSIGLDVHDSKTLGLFPKLHERIKPGMVFSDEPGIYIEGFGGIRIEDDILITKNKAVML